MISEIEKILREHVPDEEHDCWALERWCRGCPSDFSSWPYSGQNIRLYVGGGFPRHQAELIARLYAAPPSSEF